MKKVLMLLSLMLLGSSVYAGDQIIRNINETWTENPSVIYTKISVSSTTYSSSTYVNYGVNLVIQNNGSNNVRYKKGSSSNVATEGIRIKSDGIYNIDRFMGTIYFQLEPGTSGTNEIIVERTITR